MTPPCVSSTPLTKLSIFRVLRCRGEFNENLRLLDPCLSDICTDPYKVLRPYSLPAQIWRLCRVLGRPAEAIAPLENTPLHQSLYFRPTTL
jgi:hypothetical protein